MDRKDGRIENLRALAILLVVLGHSIILYSDQWNLYETEVWAYSQLSTMFDVIKDWINLIQMPLFFSISGYLFKEKKSLKALLISKSGRLLLPYVFVGALWMIPVKCLVNYPAYSGRGYFDILFHFLFMGEEQGHLWFLPCLFLCFLFGKFWNFCVMGQIKGRHRNIIAAGATVCLILVLRYLSPFLHSGLYSDFAQWFGYFETGYFLKKLDDSVRLNPYRIPFAALAVLVSAAAMADLLPIHQISSFILLLAFYEVIPEKTNAMTSLLSKESFGIYLFHSPLIYITFTFWREWNPWFVVSVNFFLFGVLALLLSIGIKKTRLKFMVGQS